MKSLRSNILGALAGLLLVGSAHAGQVAQFIEVNGTNDFLVSTVGTTTTFSGSSEVFFSFSNTLLPSNPYPGLHDAMLNFTATSTTSGAIITGNVNQGGFAGTFSIIEIGTGFNLLSGSFGASGVLNGAAGSATFSDQTPPPGEVSFTSLYLDFSISVDQSFALSLSNGVPGLTLGGTNYPNNTTFAGTGTFSANPLPGRQNTPEPATMALLGSALVAVGVTGRKKLARR